MAERKNTPLPKQIPAAEGRMKAKYYDPSTLQVPVRVGIAPSCGGSTVAFLVPDKKEHGTQTFFTAFCCLSELAANVDNEKEICAHAASMICTLFPGLTGVFKTALLEMNAPTVDVRIPSNVSDFVSPEDTEFTRALIMFGQLVQILFKDFSHADYDKSMNKTIMALCERAGGNMLTHNLKFIPFVKTQMIRARLGDRSTIRTALLKILISLQMQKSALGMVCDYLCAMLEWTNMESLVCMMNVLAAPKSPVLEDLRLANEIMNLNETVQLVKASTYPQYFQILGLNHDVRLLGSDRFPILINVAAKIQKDQYGTQIASPTGVNLAFVNELVQKHKDFMAAIILCPASVQVFENNVCNARGAEDHVVTISAVTWQ